MKTKYILLPLIIISILAVSCEKATTKLRKYHGVWEISKVEEYDNSSSVLLGTYTDAGYFLLYDQEFEDAENDCFYGSDSTFIPYLMTALGTGGYCLWWVNDSELIEFTYGTNTFQVTVEKKGYNSMNWTFIYGSNKEIFYLDRANL